MTPTLLVIGAGTLQVPLLRWAREAGLQTVVTDADPRAAGARLAGEFHALPACDLDAHLALVRSLLQRGPLAGVHVADAHSLRLLARLARALRLPGPSRTALEDALDAKRSRAVWSDAHLSVASRPAPADLEVTAFFRDGAFVPGGIAQRVGDRWILPAELSPADERHVYALVERAARALDVANGPVEVRLASGANGFELLELFPGFGVAATILAPQVYEKSPVQAWLAHLVDSGGPFDEMPLYAGRFGGWTAVRADAARGAWLDVPARGSSEATRILWATAEEGARLERALANAALRLQTEDACTPAA